MTGFFRKCILLLTRLLSVDGMLLGGHDNSVSLLFKDPRGTFWDDDVMMT